MTPQLRRRTLLASILGSVTPLLAGCGVGDPWRELSFHDVSTQETDERWQVSFGVVKQHEGPDDLTTFHDVQVHAYAHDRTEVDSKAVGTISDRHGGGNGIPVEMACSAFPTMFTYSAAESPCDDNLQTLIRVVIYDEEHGWKVRGHPRECGEGLPPEPEE